MKNIMLVCAAGMSTSLLVNKMKEAAKNKNLELDIFAIATQEVEEYINKKEIDVVLLGPQVRFMKADLEKKLAPKNIPLAVIEMTDYGMMNGARVLDTALRLMIEDGSK